MNINKHIISYIAGYCDGDGCFFIRKETIKNRFKYPGQLIITSINKTTLQFFKDNIGGSIISTNNRIKFPKHKTQYRFCICGKRSADIAEIILPFLIEKKKQCLCYIEFIRTNSKERKNFLIDKMKKLKHSFDFVSKEDVEPLKKIKRTKRINTCDFSYLSGFIDAECCLGIYRYKTKNRGNFLYKTTLTLSNTKLPCFFFLMTKFGGSITFVPQKRNHKAHLLWRLSSKSLFEIIPNIHQFIRAKKPVLEQLIKFRNLILPNGGARHTDVFRTSYQSNLLERNKIFNIVHQLNHRGI